jgi:hypothetical protein
MDDIRTKRTPSIVSVLHLTEDTLMNREGSFATVRAPSCIQEAK